MRVFGRVVLTVAGLICAAGPSTADAAPIVLGSAGTSCGGLVAATSAECQMFALDLLAPATFTGEFLTAADVALFSFTFSDETRLTVTTSSYAAGNFDPTFGLFHGGGSIVQFFDEALGDLRAARNFDADPDAAAYDETLDLVLASGSYVLALVAWPNDFTGVIESLQGGFACDAAGAGCDLGGAGTAFALEMTATPVDGGPAAVPEPGTLTLLLGGVAAAYARERARKRA